jgi:hypothetical protein
MDITKLFMCTTPNGGGTPVYDSVQHFSITIAASSASNTATVSTVDTGVSFIIWGGSRCANTNADDAMGRVTLTNSTTITATRTTSDATNSLTITGTLIESSYLVASVQRGTISLSGTSATATISSVDTARTAVSLLGASSGRAAALTQNSGHPIASLTDATTVRVEYTSTSSGTTVASYEAVEFNSSVVTSVQYAQHLAASGASTTVDVTISSVVTGDCMLLYAGCVHSASGTTMWAAQLTTATNVAFTRQAASSASQGMAVFVVELADTFAAVENVNSSYVTTSSTRDATITSIDTTKAFASYMGYRTSNAGAIVSMSTVAIKDADELTFTRTSASTDSTTDLKARVNEFL